MHHNDQIVIDLIIIIGNFIEATIEAFLFLMPAFVAIIIPVFVRRLNVLDIPVWKKAFGKNKTYRGLVFGLAGALITIRIQYQLYTDYFVIRALGMVYYDQLNYMLLGLLLGSGALAGDLIKSFFKRQLSIPEGKDWIPFDQIDFVLGAIASSFFIAPYTYLQAMMLIIVGGISHFITVKICKRLGIRKD